MRARRSSAAAGPSLRRSITATAPPVRVTSIIRTGRRRPDERHVDAARPFAPHRIVDTTRCKSAARVDQCRPPRPLPPPSGQSLPPRTLRPPAGPRPPCQPLPRPPCQSLPPRQLPPPRQPPCQRSSPPRQWSRSRHPSPPQTFYRSVHGRVARPIRIAARIIRLRVAIAVPVVRHGDAAGEERGGSKQSDEFQHDVPLPLASVSLSL